MLFLKWEADLSWIEVREILRVLQNPKGLLRRTRLPSRVIVSALEY